MLCPNRELAEAYIILRAGVCGESTTTSILLSIVKDLDAP